METTEKLFTKSQLLTRLVVGAVAGICIGLVAAFFLFTSKPFSFSNLADGVMGEVDYEEAIRSLDAYRHHEALSELGKHWKGKSSGITYDVGEFMKDYKKFETFINDPENVASLCTGCEWRLGVYPNIIKAKNGQSEIARLNVYFIPTMYDKTKNHTYDFLQLSNDNKTGIKGDSYIFDQGTIFP